MKYVRSYTLRGTVSVTTPGVKKKIDIFNGEYNRGIRVTNFQIFPSDPIFANAETSGFLATEDPEIRPIANPLRIWDWADNSQIAWAYSEDTLYADEFLARSNLVIEDLYVCIASGATNIGVGYLIEVDEFELAPYQSTLSIVGNMNQG